MTSALPFSEACERNKEPILAVLRTEFASRRAVLEIGSGTGQHAVHFAAALPHLSWQPTERAGHLSALNERICQSDLPNLRAAMELDVQQSPWPAVATDAMFTANTLHIMSWPAVEALFEGLAHTLEAQGVACLYGPFKYDGRYTSPSNEAFDTWLQSRDPASGIRELADVRALGARHGLTLRQDHDLPANNRLLVFQSAR